ncbi:MAG: molybdopterin-binding protein [Desulfatitalea sp. BRH_c12]|nr:MAG: molybdopterin-binding protein [Desulfatitalea sp. BRH_c12]
MKAIPVKHAVGMILSHDVTRIVTGGEKGPAFRKGHTIQAADVPAFLDIGKQHVFVTDLPPGMFHEDQAAERLARAVAGPGLDVTEPCEGRVNLVARHTGLLKIDVAVLHQLNAFEEIVVSTLHTNHQALAGRPVAGLRIVPLAVAAEKIAAAEAFCRQAFPLIQIKPFHALSVGMVTTGSEIYNGRIADTFGPVVRKKFESLGSRILRQIMVSDVASMTADAIRTLIREGAQMIVVTGGMSVDPDDLTPAAIRAAGAQIVTYGAPTFPGAMFMLAYIGNVPVLGLPGCVMYYKTSVFDLVVPRLLAGERLRREDITALGHGGFCNGCAECRYPVCGFGSG